MFGDERLHARFVGCFCHRATDDLVNLTVIVPHLQAYFVVASRRHNIEVAMGLRRQDAVAPREIVDENPACARVVDEPEWTSETAAVGRGSHHHRRMTTCTDFQLRDEEAFGCTARLDLFVLTAGSFGQFVKGGAQDLEFVRRESGLVEGLARAENEAVDRCSGWGLRDSCT